MKIVKEESSFCTCANSLPIPQGLLKEIIDNILDNSWIKQEDLSMSAALAFMAVITSRKFTFGNLSPNLYLLNISPSGSGKDNPQQCVKRYLSEIGFDSLLGSGDYVSDASLMDHLGGSPTRLDILDEAGGILKTVTSGRSEYNGKMADVLCELYTSSNSKYLGRTTSEGNKGSCSRPNISILASTTPTGFSEGVTRSALDKGLLGRFLTFFGDGSAPAGRLREFPRLNKDTRNKLKEIASYKPEVNHEILINGIPQEVQEMNASKEASLLLDDIFSEFDLLRRNSKSDDPMLPVTSRLYQQMIKICIIHAISRDGIKAIIEPVDILFAKQLILYYYSNMTDAVRNLVYTNYSEKNYADLLNLIPMVGSEGISSQSLSTKTRHLGKRKRDELINELLETEEIVRDTRMINDRRLVFYWRVR